MALGGVLENECASGLHRKGAPALEPQS